MIELIRRMMAARRGQAFAVGILAALTIAVAVAMPVFLAAADRSVTETEVKHATYNELAVSVQTGWSADNEAQNGTDVSSGVRVDDTFGKSVTATVAKGGFVPVFAAVSDVRLVAGADVFDYPRMVYRDGMCDHIVLEAGRCPISAMEILLPSDTAKSLKLTVGSTLPIQSAVVTRDGWVPSSYAPSAATIVGIFHPKDSVEPYWGSSGYYDFDPTRGMAEPVLTARPTFDTFPMAKVQHFVDGVVNPAAISVTSLAGLETNAASVVEKSRSAAGGVVAGTAIDQLATRIQQDRTAMRSVLPVIALPLIGLGWFVIFLASNYAISGRRTELGVVALRGSTRLPRWWLGVGEGVCAILLATPVGIALGAAVAWFISVTELPAGFGGVGLGGTSDYIYVAILGSLVAVLAAAWRPVRSSTVDLLRDVPERGSAWRSVAFDFVIVALAGAGVFQLLSQTGPLVGVQLVAPALAIGAVAVIVARLVGPIATMVGRWGLRGRARRAGPRRLGTSLGALQLARRPGAARLFALFTVAIGMITFAAADLDVANESTTERAKVQLGATRVLDTVSMTRTALRDDVRKADPDGKWAMAVSGITQPSITEPPILAVDSDRLAAVANWPSGGPTAAQAAKLLNPGADPGVHFTAYSIAVDVSLPNSMAYTPADYTETSFDSPPGLTVQVEPATGGGVQSAQARLEAGRHAVTLDTPWCGQGCRLVSVAVDQFGTRLPQGISVTLHSLSTVLPTPGLVTKFDGPFRRPDNPSGDRLETLAPTPDGLSVTGDPNGGTLHLEALPADAPYPVPVLSAVPLKHRYQGLIEGQQVPMVRVGGEDGMPRVAGVGMLVDLTAVDRAFAGTVDHSALLPQVWLGPHAPADALTRLRNAGLQIRAEHTLAEELGYLRAQGPATGRHFFTFGLVAVLVVALGGALVTAAVDRDRRGRELRGLRTQGLPRASVRRAAFVGQVSLAIAAAVIGPVVGLGVWKLCRAKIPIFVDGDNTFVAAHPWPRPTSVLMFWGAAAVVLVGMMFLTAWDLRRVVRRNDLGSAR